jgi:predicted small metal-binding protein
MVDYKRPIRPLRLPVEVDRGNPGERQEVFMERKYIDCREYPSEMNCTLMMSADSEAELLEAAVQHAVAVHNHQDTPELRDQLRKLFKTQPMARAA